MKRVRLSLRSDPWAVGLGRVSGVPVRVAAAAFLLLSIAALTSAVLRWQQLSQTMDARLAATASAERAPPARHVTGEPASAASLAALARSARHLNTPWATILDALERHAGVDVALLAIDHDAGQGRLRVELEARQLKSLVNFAHRLGSSNTFERVALSKHELIDRDPAKPVRMALEVKLASDAGPTSASVGP